MYFKLNNKLLKINSYQKFNKIINNISTPYTYILINDKHYKNINYAKFSSLPVINEININYKLNGGFINVIVEALVSIYKFMLLIPKILIWLVQFIIWLLRFAIFILISFFGLFQGSLSDIVKNIIKIIIYEPINLIVKLIKKIFGDGINKDKSDDPNYRCYGISEDGTIPTTILISTILCPPLGVFMMYGITGWLYILISAMLSLFYYIPGLTYAFVLFYT
jgi:uncharacterized membrane protein YqaE (UPF0057 family)